MVLEELLRHNGWANARVFKVCAASDPALLTAPADGSIGTAMGTLAHMVIVLEAFSSIIGGAVGTPQGMAFRVNPDGLEDGYFDHDLGWYGERAAVLDDFLAGIARRASAEDLDHAIRVPWLDFPMTVGRGLTQVLVHNAHHRSQVFSILGAGGVRVPDLDYVVMLAKEQSAATA